MKPRVGGYYSVWFRATRRHKWICVFGIVRLISRNGVRCQVQTSYTETDDPDGILGPTCFSLRGSGPWEREFRKPITVKTDPFE